jgi:hypothetical protein
VHPRPPPIEITDHTASCRRFISGQCERYLGTLDAAGNLDHADSLCRGERPAVCPTVWPHRSRRAGARGRTCSSDIEVRQRACRRSRRRYAASPPWTAAGRRTFMPAEPKRWADLAETDICRARRLAPARSPSMSTKSLITEVCDQGWPDSVAGSGLGGPRQRERGTRPSLPAPPTRATRPPLHR